MIIRNNSVKKNLPNSNPLSSIKYEESLKSLLDSFFLTFFIFFGICNELKNEDDFFCSSSINLSSAFTITFSLSFNLFTALKKVENIYIYYKNNK